MPAVVQGKSTGFDGGCRLKLPADLESYNMFLRRSPLLARMGVYFLLATSFVCFAASLLLLQFPQPFPLHLIPPFRFVKQQATDKPSNQWNILYHLGGNGPWIPKIDGVVDGGITTPNGCRIDMIHMVGCLLYVVIQGSELTKIDVTTWREISNSKRWRT